MGFEYLFMLGVGTVTIMVVFWAINEMDTLKARIRKLESDLYAVRESRCKYQRMVESMLANPGIDNIVKNKNEYSEMEHTC